jgi:hypothetical protein
LRRDGALELLSSLDRHFGEFGATPDPSLHRVEDWLRYGRGGQEPARMRSERRATPLAPLLLAVLATARRSCEAKPEGLASPREGQE